VEMNVELTQGNYLLRPVDVNDASAILEAVMESGDDLKPWMSWYHEGFSLQDSRSWVEFCLKAWQGNSEYNFVITDIESRIVLGGCGLNHINHTDKLANLGYWVRTSFKGRDAATTTARLLARFAFDDIELNRVEIVVAIGNKASGRVAVKAGAKKEGVLRNRLALPSALHDAFLFSMIPEDLNKK
jgi:ribosomal-protein-serine acetyltransferase